MNLLKKKLIAQAKLARDAAAGEDGSEEEKTRQKELADAIELEIPEEAPYDTVAGFFQHQYGKIPQVGSEFEFEGWQFVVQDADEKRVITLDINLVLGDNEADEEEGIVQTLKDAVGL